MCWKTLSLSICAPSCAFFSWIGAPSTFLPKAVSCASWPGVSMSASISAALITSSTSENGMCRSRASVNRSSRPPLSSRISHMPRIFEIPVDGSGSMVVCIGVCVTQL